MNSKQSMRTFSADLREEQGNAERDSRHRERQGRMKRAAPKSPWCASRRFSHRTRRPVARPRRLQLLARLLRSARGAHANRDPRQHHALPADEHRVVSSARLYRKSKLAFFAPKGVAIPVAVSALQDEVDTAPRRGTEPAYPKLLLHGRLATWAGTSHDGGSLRSSRRNCVRGSDRCAVELGAIN